MKTNEEIAEYLSEAIEAVERKLKSIQEVLDSIKELEKLLTNGSVEFAVRASPKEIKALGPILDVNSEKEEPVSLYITAKLALGFTKSQVIAIDNAVHFWNKIILKGAPNGLTINFYVSNIDGKGGTYGMASPITLDRETGLPSFGMVSLDAADLVKMEREGILMDVIRHEICHVMGFGTIWEMKGLLSESLSGGMIFTGVEASKELHKITGIYDFVPVESRGGPGTKGSHWREFVFDNELMTSYVEKGNNSVSKMTIASLADLGYSVAENTPEEV